MNFDILEKCEGGVACRRDDGHIGKELWECPMDPAAHQRQESAHTTSRRSASLRGSPHIRWGRGKTKRGSANWQSPSLQREPTLLKMAPDPVDLLLLHSTASSEVSSILHPKRGAAPTPGRPKLHWKNPPSTALRKPGSFILQEISRWVCILMNPSLMTPPENSLSSWKMFKLQISLNHNQISNHNQRQADLP